MLTVLQLCVAAAATHASLSSSRPSCLQKWEAEGLKYPLTGMNSPTAEQVRCCTWGLSSAGVVLDGWDPHRTMLPCAVA